MEYQNNDNDRRNVNEPEEYDRRMNPRRGTRMDMHDETMQPGMYERGSARMKKTDTREKEKMADEAYEMLDEQMCRALSFHSQLADYFCFLGLQGFKRMAEYQYMKECAEMRKLHRRYIDNHGRVLKTKNITKPNIIPSGWSQYTTKDISDNVMPKFAKQGLEDWYEWEKAAKEVYEDVCDMLMNAGLHADCEYVKELLEDAEKECKKVMRLMERLNGTGYDVTAVHGMQDKLHEKYKKKYTDRFTVKNNYHRYREWDDEEGRRDGRHMIGY